jgi:hypothetical protein
MNKKQTLFEKLSAINVNGKTEQKNGLTYLSWAWALFVMGVGVVRIQKTLSGCKI